MRNSLFPKYVERTHQCQYSIDQKNKSLERWREVYKVKVRRKSTKTSLVNGCVFRSGRERNGIGPQTPRGVSRN